MARQINRLSPRAVATLTKPGRHADGGGLYLVVDASGAKRWAFLFRRNGKLREMGLGGLNSVPLGTARGLASTYRADVAAGRDPLEARKASKAEIPTFGAFADAFIETKSPEWRGKKHHDQWSMTLTVYAAPLRTKPINAIGVDDVLAVLKPLWLAKPETASRVRGRIENVLDGARAAGHRTGENPARWRGHLDKLLPRRQRLAQGHHPAMPFDDVPAFISRLREDDGVVARALEFTILTAARSGEVFGAEWDEIDFATGIWTIPATRMKSGREHRVPLPSRVAAILEEMAKVRNCAFVFPGQRGDKRMSNTALSKKLHRMKVDATAHGFRSSFRDWAGERTSFPREVAEAALAHAVGDQTEQAYRRGDALAKRRILMEAWARFCESKPAANVVALAARGSSN